MKKNKTWKVVGIVAIVVLVLIGAFAAYRYKTAKPQNEAEAAQTTADTTTVKAPAPGAVDRDYFVSLQNGAKPTVPVTATPAQHAIYAAELQKAKDGKLADLKFLGLGDSLKVSDYKVGGAPKPQVQSQDDKPESHWYQIWWVWLIAIAVIAVTVGAVVWLVKNPPSGTMGPGAWLIILVIALVVCWALFFRADWQFLVWPGTLLPLMIFMYIRQLLLDDWWKAINHPIAHVYVVAWVVMFFIIVVAGVKNHGGSF
jgi:hypothetical protein